MKAWINSHGHMTKIAAMAINNKLLKNIPLQNQEAYDFETRRPMILKLGMKHQGIEVYKICINHDPGMTLTYFTARST